MLKLSAFVLSLIGTDGVPLAVAEFDTADQCGEVLLHVLYDANCTTPPLAPAVSIIPKPRPKGLSK